MSWRRGAGAREAEGAWREFFFSRGVALAPLFLTAAHASLTPPLPTHSDYRPMPALDAYEDADLDEDVDDPDLAPDARAAAERAMARRDVREGRAGRRGPRLPGALQGVCARE